MNKLLIAGLLFSTSLATFAQQGQGGSGINDQVLSEKILSEMSEGVQWHVRAITAEQKLAEYMKDKECTINKEIEKQKKETEKKQEKESKKSKD